MVFKLLGTIVTARQRENAQSIANWVDFRFGFSQEFGRFWALCLGGFAPHICSLGCDQANQWAGSQDHRIIGSGDPGDRITGS